MGSEMCIRDRKKMNSLFPDGKELKGLLPNAKKGLGKTVRGGSLAVVLLGGLGGCFGLDFVKGKLGFGPSVTEQAKRVADKHKALDMAKGIHEQALISVKFDEDLNRCVIIWE